MSKRTHIAYLIREVVADIDDVASEIVLIVHWVGGALTSCACRSAGADSATAPLPILSKPCRQLVLIASDDLIAGLLNRNGLKTGNGNRWTCERVTSMRSSFTSLCSSRPITGSNPGSTSATPQAPEDRAQDAAAGHKAGESVTCHPLSDGPWIFARTSLITTAAQSIAERARRTATPRGITPIESLFSSTT